MWTWALLPLGFSSLGVAGFWTVYIVAGNNTPVSPLVSFPYISDCGTYPPQSCLFGQLLNVGGFTVLVICLIRYRQVEGYGYHSWINTLSLLMGVLCAFGATLVGNFQETNHLPTHMVGAVLTFGAAVLYFWLQCVLVLRVRPRHGGLALAGIRIIACILATSTYILAPVFYYEDMRNASAICEWILAMDVLLYFGTFAVEFKHITHLGLRLEVDHTCRMNSCNGLMSSASSPLTIPLPNAHSLPE
ncbi:modulator of macroautophagy TMEM150B-like isoform X1 [Lethenteron reissneri]|uniref:modulator of macroautophagy TMEM150B-like isoform X1 n=1 Tax=Lethenteron reissneri TaxID=7753 RepID=UPI002AB5EC98|nr:modulator of macroautophagy TMEM150B-like isoform X1 [Lethenteron reissneri]XP_061416145.1 modulator of macroautophagy TMEM150B-like isoform X1 [Lethenteron reissneri]XP_061416146.1 modulator of macroautophagy TMEM150B-like isoform X1 [Lethenteron reissneri]